MASIDDVLSRIDVVLKQNKRIVKEGTSISKLLFSKQGLDFSTHVLHGRSPLATLLGPSISLMTI